MRKRSPELAAAIYAVIATAGDQDYRMNAVEPWVVAEFERIRAEARTAWTGVRSFKYRRGA